MEERAMPRMNNKPSYEQQLIEQTLSVLKSIEIKIKEIGCALAKNHKLVDSPDSDYCGYEFWWEDSKVLTKFVSYCYGSTGTIEVKFPISYLWEPNYLDIEKAREAEAARLLKEGQALYEAQLQAEVEARQKSMSGLLTNG